MPHGQMTGGTPVNITATTTIGKTSGQLIGVFVNSTSSGTLALYDGTSTAGTVIIPAVALVALTYYPIPAVCNDGLHAVIANTMNVTIFYA